MTFRSRLSAYVLGRAVTQVRHPSSDRVELLMSVDEAEMLVNFADHFINGHDPLTGNINDHVQFAQWIIRKL